MSGEGAVNVQVQKARRLHDADVVYLYDSSFEGFLCCVFESFAQHEIPFAVWTPQRETSTLYPVKDIPTDHAKAQRVFASFGRKLGPETEYLVSRDFLSGREDKELLLIRFLHLAFALGPGTVKRTGHPDVAPLYEMKKSLDWEVDKFQGFVRFEEHDGMLGAVIHPTWDHHGRQELTAHRKGRHQQTRRLSLHPILFEITGNLQHDICRMASGEKAPIMALRMPLS